VKLPPINDMKEEMQKLLAPLQPFGYTASTAPGTPEPTDQQIQQKKIALEDLSAKIQQFGDPRLFALTTKE